MNISFNWLRQFVPVDLSPQQLRDLITARVATVDSVTPLRADLEPFVVARVVETARHPDSDKLSVNKVDAGTGELLDVVCGAPNVRAGALYPFAKTGTVMPGGLKIERRKIRGAVSHGMLCSARELGLGQDHDGIMELDLDAAPGTPFLQALAVGDTRLEVDVTPNRPDLLSHLGLAREVAAATGVLLDPLAGRGPELTSDAAAALRAAAEQGPAAVDALMRQWGDEGPSTSSVVIEPAAAATATEGEVAGVTVRIEDVEGCPRYLGAVVRGVTVGPSPDWLREAVESVGGRSINNVVDVTNYMLHGFGQPMHAFDLARLEGASVIVRRATTGERLTTLDGQSRALAPGMLVIADARRAVALAGIIGGRDSEVNEATTDVFLEVAAFDARSVRQARKKLGLSTDASYRFERGTDVDSAGIWLSHAVHLLLETAGGTAVGAVDVYPRPGRRDPVSLRVSRVARVLGEPVPAVEIASLLRGVGFEVGTAPGTEMLRGDEDLVVIVPTWRPDVTAEIDLIEEVARLRGYDTFSSELRPYRTGRVPDAPLHLTARRLREALVAEGLLEARPMPFVKGAAQGHVRVQNPLAENEAYLRTELLDSLARRAEYNLAHMQGNVRLFEVGAAFLPAEDRLPREEMRVGALVMGERRPPHFTEPRPPRYDAWDAKALAERVAAVAFPGERVELRPVGQGALLWEVVVGGVVRGRVVRVALDAPVWASEAFGVELTLAELESGDVAAQGEAAHLPDGASDRARPPVPGFRPLPVTPAAEFDLALLVPDATPAARVEETIRKAAGELLERVALFDEFRGQGVPSGHRSLAWRLTFRHSERTLRDKEVEGRREKLLRTLESELGVRPRA